MINLYTERMHNLGPCNNVNYLHGLNDLCTIYLNKNSLVLELGTNDGISTALFAHHAKQVISIDLNISNRLLSTLNNHNNIIFSKSNFHHLVPLFQNNSFDLIYVDGHHDLLNFKNDLQLVLPKLKNNAILAGHDYNPQYGQDVINYINNITQINNIQDLSIFSDSSWAFKVTNTDKLILP